MAELLFYVLSLLCLAGAAGVVLAKSPMVSVLSLLMSFFCLAVIYLLAGFQFMAAAQLLVYAGAIMVLFLFVIMLLNLAGTTHERWIGREVLRDRRLPLVLGIGGALLLVTLLAVGGTGVAAAADAAPTAPADGAIDSPLGLAEALFGRFLLAFEAASILLLAAAVAVLVLAKRQRGPGGAGEGGAA